MEIEIRPVVPADIAAIHAIYRESVLTNTASWEWDAPDFTEMERRVQALVAQNFPFLVAVASGTGAKGTVAGYCYASSYRTRAGYRYTVEDSIYIDSAYRGRGIGAKLLDALIVTCAAAGYRQMIAVIGGSQQVASIALHEKLGFQQVGLLPNIGLKHDRWLDCVLMQRALGEGGASLPSAIPQAVSAGAAY